jgi:hypothetical protein
VTGTTGETPGAGAIIGGCHSEILTLKLFNELTLATASALS